MEKNTDKGYIFHRIFSSRKFWPGISKLCLIKIPLIKRRRLGDSIRFEHQNRYREIIGENQLVGFMYRLR